MHTNAWILLEQAIAQSWNAWYHWRITDRQMPEPSIDDLEKVAVNTIVDFQFAYSAFKESSLSGKIWHCLPLWGIDHALIDGLYALHGDGLQGGNFQCAGFWQWSRGDVICARDSRYLWHPDTILQFMPDECISRDSNGNCTAYQPATALRDIQLLQGQPGLDFSEAA